MENADRVAIVSWPVLVPLQFRSSFLHQCHWCSPVMQCYQCQRQMFMEDGIKRCGHLYFLNEYLMIIFMTAISCLWKIQKFYVDPHLEIVLAAGSKLSKSTTTCGRWAHESMMPFSTPRRSVEFSLFSKKINTHPSHQQFHAQDLCFFNNKVEEGAIYSKRP